LDAATAILEQRSARTITFFEFLFWFAFCFHPERTILKQTAAGDHFIL
jgi:hypothetical protein